jgi:CBS domain-containing protein
VEDDQLIGLISIADLIHAIATLRIKQEIKDHYTSQTFALWEETPLPVVGRVMEISGFEAIPILDADSKLQGIISERDLIRHSSIEDTVEVSDFSNGTDDDEWTWESIRDMHTISYGISKIQLPPRPVKTAMVKNVVSVPLNAEVSECALKMKRARIDQLPVINGDKRLVAMLFEKLQILILGVAYRDDHAPVYGKLIEQRQGRSRCSSGNQNGIERCELRQTERPIAAMNMNVMVSEPREPLCSGRGQLCAALDGENFLCQLR